MLIGFDGRFVVGEIPISRLVHKRPQKHVSTSASRIEYDKYTRVLCPGILFIYGYLFEGSSIASDAPGDFSLYMYDVRLG